MSKRQWTITLIIILLLVVGTGVTLVNKKYIDRHFNYAVEITQTKSASSAERGSDSPAEETKGNETLAAGVSGAGQKETQAQDAQEGAAGAANRSEDQAAPADLKDSYDTGTVNENLQKAESQSEEELPVITQEKTVLMESTSGYLSSEDYYQKLDSMEQQIKKTWSDLKKPTVQDEKAVAQYEYKLWDDELNYIYRELRSNLTEEEFDQLRQEEKAWLKVRDQTADSAAMAANTTNEQELHYTLSLTATTKERTYELAEMYFDYIEKHPIAGK